MKKWFVFLFVFVSGCTFSSSQFEIIKNLVEKEPIDNYLWRVTYGENSQILTAVMSNENLLFVNSHGDALLFDGWTVRSLVGFGLGRSPLTIRDDVTGRVYNHESNVSRHNCGSWIKNESSDGSVQMIQRCDGRKDMENYILLDSEGRIVEIDQLVSILGGRIRLEKM